MTKLNQVFTSLTTKTLVALSLFVAVESQAALCDQVWTGTIERARVQEQASGETVVRLYITPGHNADYVGYTTSDFMVDVLLKAKKEMSTVTGYTDAKCQIKWVDFQ